MANATNAEKPLTTPRRTDRPRMRPPRRPTLRFTPWAWAKLLFLRDLGETEVGGFGISAAHDLLLIEDIQMVRQRCTSVTVQFEDAAVADFFDEQVDRGLAPERFARVWIHTHPGSSPAPSWVDEGTFLRSFGRSDWAIMFVVAQGGQTSARLRFNVGPGGDCELPVAVDFDSDFAAPDRAAWRAEYESCVSRPIVLAAELLSRNDVVSGLAAALEHEPFEDLDWLEEQWFDERWEAAEQFAQEVAHG